jgi:hypothetical protein
MKGKRLSHWSSLVRVKIALSGWAGGPIDSKVALHGVSGIDNV